MKKYAGQPLTTADALIAATAWEKKLALVSKNQKHFRFIDEIRLNRSDPF